MAIAFALKNVCLSGKFVPLGMTFFLLTTVYVFQALIIRDYWLLTVISVLFEVLEYSLEHQLPNFCECWWDHVSPVIYCI